jgi:outer membrane protein TolC
MSLARAKALLTSTVAVSFALAAPIHAQGPAGTAQQGSITIDLRNALERARNNSPQLQSAALNIDLTREDRLQAKAALYPTLGYFNQYIYTQGNGTSSGVFVPNDGVHIYNSQAALHQELFSPARLSEYRRSIAAEALAAAKRDVVARGLVAVVIQNYYAAVVALRHHGNALRALDEARRFVEITEKLESGGEVARSDVVKAQLVLQQRQRDVQEARLAVEKSRIELAVLLFPDFRLDFTLVDDLSTMNPLPPFEDIQTLAREKSPELRAAQESIRQEEFGIKIARTAYLPSLSFDYFFGISANQFAVYSGDRRNLGSVAEATLNIPVWNWWATKSKVHQAEVRRRQAQLDLILTQKQLVSSLHSLYAEAQSSLAQVDSLRRSLDLSGESLRLTTLRYQAGEVTVLEVVDAQSTLVQARNAYDDGLSRYRLALANLQTLTGAY